MGAKCPEGKRKVCPKELSFRNRLRWPVGLMVIAAQAEILTGVSAEQSLEQMELEALQQAVSQVQEVEAGVESGQTQLDTDVADGNSVAGKELLREWGFSLTPDPAIDYSAAPTREKVDVAVKDMMLVSPTGDSLGICVVEDTRRGDPCDDSTRSQIECDAEDAAASAPNVRPEKRKKFPPLWGEKLSCSKEEGITLRAKRSLKTQRSQRLASEDEDEPSRRQTRANRGGKAPRRYRSLG